MRPQLMILLNTILAILTLVGCTADDDADGSEDSAKKFADIVSVTASGNSENYRFAVGISSPDTGCEQYADWWEVISLDEKLLYRRILAHSHVNEQPFVRSGGAVKIAADTEVWVRAHMNKNGYGGKVFFGSVEQGFAEREVSDGFAAALESQQPLPTGCNF